MRLKALDTFCFTPDWTAKTMNILNQLNANHQILMLASHSDPVSDTRGKNHFYHHIFNEGKHARLFYDNDFDVVKKFLENHPYFLKK